METKYKVTKTNNFRIGCRSITTTLYLCTDGNFGANCALNILFDNKIEANNICLLHEGAKIETVLITPDRIDPARWI